LDDVLANWPDGARGVLMTDALDAVRDVETQRMLRCLLQDVQRGPSGWTVVASVREFDLKYGRELREAFPGAGGAGHRSSELSNVSHLHVTGLADAKLDALVAEVAEIGPFIASARKNLRAGGVHRSPFFLRLAAELLKDGVSPARLADWSSPAILLRRFWKARVTDGGGASHRKVALETPIVHILARLNAISETFEKCQLSNLNAASRGVLANHVAKDVSKGWRYAALTAIETLCKTFKVSAAETEGALVSLLAPQRLAHFPHWVLFDFARQLKYLGRDGDSVVLSLFEAAFSNEPTSDQWEDLVAPSCRCACRAATTGIASATVSPNITRTRRRRTLA
jgi:hypothetical protein